MICSKDVLSNHPVAYYLREYIKPFVGESDLIELLLHFLLADEGIYEQSLPNATFYELNFPTLWDSEMQQTLAPTLSRKAAILQTKELGLFRAIRRSWPNFPIYFPRLTKDKFIASWYNVKSG